MNPGKPSRATALTGVSTMKSNGSGKYAASGRRRPVFARLGATARSAFKSAGPAPGGAWFETVTLTVPLPSVPGT